MKILLIGPTDSIWVKAYIENVLLNQKIEITVIGKKNNRFFNFYKDNNIRIIDTDVVATKNSSIKKYQDIFVLYIIFLKRDLSMFYMLNMPTIMA